MSATTEQKHTPGPWEVRPSNNEIVNTDHGLLPFAISSGYTLIGALYENGSDARLIAAAPELLDALVMLEKVYTAMRETLSEKYPQDGWSAKTMTLDQARAAIAKATGATHDN